MCRATARCGIKSSIARLALCGAALLLALGHEARPIATRAAPAAQVMAFAPFVAAGSSAIGQSTGTLPTAAPSRVNAYRALAGLQAASFDSTLDANCAAHARYMSSTGILTHQEDTGSPYYSDAGQICAGKGNVWLGSQPSGEFWTQADSVDAWMQSPGHRLWLLYPTTRTFGNGFDSRPGYYAGAALDVLSGFDPSQDGAYQGWPLKYPAPNQAGIPAIAYPVTLSWRYFGPSPTLGTAMLTTASGTAVPSSATTNIVAAHKGILITPSLALPAATRITVAVTGAYDGAPFSHTWSFTTR